ncbi:hypothetical protein AB0L70_12340 [Kribbella sp. NPDC051952]|uniref:hypothetical protein n=1 Tax=Kribbella sp. NPDC051952 TaxID=3154851 RepID=UPI00344442C9
MRTEEDLRDAFDHLASTAPTSVELRTQEPVRRRRTGPIIATALATATAAVAAVVVPHVISHDGTDPAGQDKRNTAWSRWVDLNLPKNIEAVGQRFTANRQDYELYDVVQLTWPTYCQLQLHRNGDFNPSTIPAGSPTVTIGGHKARVVTSTNKKPFLPAPQGYRFPALATVHKTLTWQPVDGVWALLNCESQRQMGTVQLPTIDGPFEANLGLETSLAKSFSPPTRSLGSPVKFSERPNGASPREIRYQPFEKGIPGSGESFTVLLSDGNPATGYIPPAPRPKAPVGGNVWDAARGDDLSIRYDTSKFWDQMTRIPGSKPDAVIHGMKAYYTREKITYSKTDPSKVSFSGELNTLHLEGNGVGVVITSYAAKPSKQELLRVAESLELTKNPKNPGAWFDAAVAIP